MEAVSNKKRKWRLQLIGAMSGHESARAHRSECGNIDQSVRFPEKLVTVTGPGELDRKSPGFYT